MEVLICSPLSDSFAFHFVTYVHRSWCMTFYETGLTWLTEDDLYQGCLFEVLTYFDFFAYIKRCGFNGIKWGKSTKYIVYYQTSQNVSQTFIVRVNEMSFPVQPTLGKNMVCPGFNLCCKPCSASIRLVDWSLNSQ